MRSAVRRLLPYALRHRRRYVTGLTCVAITTIVALSAPWILKYAIDDLHQGVTRGKLAFYAALLLAVGVVGGTFRFLMRRIVIGASRDIEYDLRNDFFAKLQTLDLAYFQARRTGDLMSRATNDLNAVRMMIGPAVMYSVNTVLIFAIASVLMLSIDPWLTAIALVPLPFVTISVRYFGTVHPPALRPDPGAALRPERRRAGGAVRRAGGAGLRPGGVRVGPLPGVERGVRPAQPRPHPPPGACSSRA